MNDEKSYEGAPFIPSVTLLEALNSSIGSHSSPLGAQLVGVPRVLDELYIAEPLFEFRVTVKGAEKLLPRSYWPVRSASKYKINVSSATA